MEYDRISEEAIAPKKRIENYKNKEDAAWTVVYLSVTVVAH